MTDERRRLPNIFRLLDTQGQQIDELQARIESLRARASVKPHGPTPDPRTWFENALAEYDGTPRAKMKLCAAALGLAIDGRPDLQQSCADDVLALNRIFKAL